MSVLQRIDLSADPATLLDQIRHSPSRSIVLDRVRTAVPELPPDCELPQTTYTLYRQYALIGDRAGYEARYFQKRAMLTRAVIELILGELDTRDLIQDLLWSICEETSWVLPAHEDHNEKFAALDGDAVWPTGTSTALTREPDVIDLFAAETGASLAETLFLIGNRLAPEVVQRVQQEVERHVFRPYLAYGRKYWWHKGDLNWNAVCNGAVGLAFMRLEKNPRRLAEALTLVLDGFEAYIATGFEADGGSLEGIGYWNYGLVYYVTLAELLREQSNGALDLLAGERIREIARFPVKMALTPGIYLNYGDAREHAALQPGVVQRLAERTHVPELKGLLNGPDDQAPYGMAALAITLRDMAWWDARPQAFPAAAFEDAWLPACEVIKLTGQTPRKQPVILAAKAGKNTGHHYHLDIAHFTINIDGETLLCDPGRGLYSRAYFHEGRFENIFCNSFGHSVPRIGGRLQVPGPKFGGNGPLAEGKIIAHGQDEGRKFALIDFAELYDLPALILARRKLSLTPDMGEIWLEDTFEFATTAGAPPGIEEAFVTWLPVSVDSASATVTGQRTRLLLHIQEPAGVSFQVTPLEEDCRANQMSAVLNRITVTLPEGAQRFVMRLAPG